jgi:polyhydroxyalkanoate synthesis regulator phasin
MSYIKHEAKTSRQAIEALVEDLENPEVALLNKRVSGINQITDAADIVRIHNGMVKAIEELNQRLEAIEAKVK